MRWWPRGAAREPGPGYTISYGEPFGGHPIKYICLREGCKAEMQTSVYGGKSALELLMRLRDIHEEVAHGQERKPGEPQAGPEYYLG